MEMEENTTLAAEESSPAIEESTLAADNPEYSLEDGIAEDESLPISDAESDSGSGNESDSESVETNSDGDYLGWAYLVPTETTEAETEPQIVEIHAPALFSAVSVGREVYGSYADLVLTYNGNTYEFVVPSAQLDKLIIEVGEDGSLILINNSGSNVVLQGKVNYTSTNAAEFYQLTVPATNLANNVYSNGGYCYLTTYYVENSYLRSQNNYLSSVMSGTLSTDNLSEDYTSAPSFYSYVMAMLFLTVALLMSLSFKWRVKLHDK